MAQAAAINVIKMPLGHMGHREHSTEITNILHY